MALIVQVAILKIGFNGSALSQLGICRKELKLGSSDSTSHPLLHPFPGPKATCFERQIQTFKLAIASHLRANLNRIHRYF